MSESYHKRRYVFSVLYQWLGSAVPIKEWTP
jgi:hypothetical protein